MNALRNCASVCLLSALAIARPVEAREPLGGSPLAIVDAAPLQIPREQDAAAVVETPLNGSRTIILPGVTRVLVLEEGVCRADVTGTGIRFTGLLRGDSVVFVWVGERWLTLLVRVTVPRSAESPAPRSVEQRAQPGQGQLSSSAQVALGPTGEKTYYFQHQIDWTEQAGGQRVGVRAQAQDATTQGVPFNVSTASMQYERPGLAVTMLDFGLTMNGGAQARVTNYSPLNSYVFRGADAVFTEGRTRLELFGGASLPSYFRSLKGTSQIGGVNLGYRPSPRLYLYGTSAVVALPERKLGDVAVESSRSFFGTSGLSLTFNPHVSMQATTGGSTHGLYGDATIAVTAERFSGWLAAQSSSPEFPLNQLQLLSGGGSSVRGLTTWNASSRISTSLFYQRAVARPTRFFPSFAGTSDYLNPSVSLALSHGQSLTFSAVRGTASGGPASPGRTGTRIETVGWTAPFLGRFVNTVQASAVRLDDPQAINAGTRVDVGDDLGVHIGNGSLNIGFQHTQQDPTLATRIRQQLNLLPTDLQELFLSDPAGFVQSSRLPSDVRASLDALQAADSQFSLSGQFSPHRRLNLSASYRLLQNAQSSNQRARTHTFGYVLGWQMTQTLQLRSSLSDSYALDLRRGDLVRNATFLLGVNKSFHAALPFVASSTRHDRIGGQVFVDRNSSGVPDAGEPGLPGLIVKLSNGRTATTDAAGRFEFSDLKPGEYQVTLPLGQFHDPVRVTTLASVGVNLLAQPQADIRFGVVNFARVMGTVFNDYMLDDARRPDAPGVARVALTLTGLDGSTRRMTTDGSGDFRVDDVNPGTYRVEIVPDTIPANFMMPAGFVNIEVKPVRTAIVDLPLRALRSVGGRVLLRTPAPVPGGQPSASPVPGVTVVAGGRESMTDADGRFVLRDLPAGDLSVTLKVTGPLPPGVSTPTGAIRLPKDPVQIDNAVIVLNSPDLLRFLSLR